MSKIVYVLSNPAMPGLVKIGYTTHEDANVRISQLYSTGVPVPFKIEFVCRVENAEEVEGALHIAFGPYRVNPKREFFKIEAEQAVSILRLLHKDDITKEVTEQPSGLDQESIVAAENLTLRRPNLNFEEMGIPVGAVLQSTRNESRVVVTGPRKVKLGDEEMSITAATKEVLGIQTAIGPGLYWTYQGKLLRQIYNETYSESE